MAAEQSINVRFIRIPLLAIAVVALGLSSCTTARNAWVDFNAYFNTYYNAKTAFDQGVRQIENQDIVYNPERPIRIHPTPPQVGQNAFEETVLKSADIIHYHEDSRWVDNAVELMGKAYFYQQEFFSAAQNFDEIYHNAVDERRRQNAVLWRGKAFMEMEEYSAGITYLYNHLNSGEFEWAEQTKAEVKLVLGQLFTYAENWEEAEYYLTNGLEANSDRILSYRGHFLLGQVYERLDNSLEALMAYEVAMDRRNAEFDLQYHAHIKKGEMLRELGRYQETYDHFHDMSRNDNFYEFLGDIEYQKAKTLHAAGDIYESMEYYKITLQQEINPPSRKVNSLIYYQLAEIYRDYFQDYTIAAAYYDSSLTAMPNPDVMPVDHDVQLMAESFGEYADLKSRTARLDSLLWLGSLEDEEFDAVIDEIRQEKIRQLEEEMREQETSRDVVVHEQDLQESDDIDDIDDNGFLNHLNRERSNRASQQFTAYWGNRPLVDDWRRGDAVRLAVREGESEEDIDEDEVIVDPEEAGDQMVAQQVTVDISDVPFEPEEREEMRRQMAAASYEIANVFFLSLDMPDSAAVNYERVIKNYPDSDLVSQSLYSLTEVYLSLNDSIKAMEYAEQLIDEHPGTIYAHRTSERMGIPLPEEALRDTASDTTQIEWNRIREQLSDGYSRDHAEALRKFASNYPESEQAPLALYHASMAYINIARDDTVFAEMQNTRTRKKREWEQEHNYITAKQDTARTILEADTTLAENEMDYWQSWADTTVTEPDFSEYDPYTNAYWDSVRVVVAELQDNYQDFVLSDKLAVIQDEVGRPEQPEEAEDEAVAEPEVNYEFAECDELDRDPEVLGGTGAFFTRSGFQEIIDQMMLSGEFEVTVIMDEDGYVIDVLYTEEDDPLGFMEELEEAMLEEMRLTPPRIDNMQTKARCTITLELQYSN